MTCFEDLLCGALDPGKGYKEGKSATAPCGGTCSEMCFEDLLCGSVTQVPAGKQRRLSGSAACGGDCSVTCFEDVTCTCDTPGAGAFGQMDGHNKYTCSDNTEGHCSSEEECYAPTGTTFVWGDWPSGCREVEGRLCGSVSVPPGKQLAHNSGKKDTSVCTSSDCSDCFEDKTCGCPQTDYTLMKDVCGTDCDRLATDVCGINCDSMCFEPDNDNDYEDESQCVHKQGRIQISDIHADRMDEVASQQNGQTETIRQLVTELRAMQTENSVAHITGIWCFMLPDCTSPHYNREQHGPCVDNCELFYTQNPSNCRQRLCSTNHNGGYSHKGRCQAPAAMYCPDDFQPTAVASSK